MKKFTKLFLSCAAVAAVTAAVATSAMAAEIAVTPEATNGLEGATYDPATNAVKVTAPADADTTKDMTFLVIDGAVNTEVAQDKVIGIDQNTGLPTNTGLKDNSVVGEDEDEATYTVKLGYYTTAGDFKVLTGTFKSGKSSGTAILVGDVDENNRISPQDSVLILQYYAGDLTKITGTAFMKAAYCDGNNRISPQDSVEILKDAAGDHNREHVGKLEIPTVSPAK